MEYFVIWTCEASRKCGGGKGTAYSQVSDLIGLLTGSTAIMLALLLGGSCIVVDKCDPENSREKASEEADRRFSLAGTSFYSSVIKSQIYFMEQLFNRDFIPYLTMNVSCPFLHYWVWSLLCTGTNHLDMHISENMPKETTDSSYNS